MDRFRFTRMCRCAVETDNQSSLATPEDRAPGRWRVDALQGAQASDLDDCFLTVVLKLKRPVKL